MANALDHMWGHVSNGATAEEQARARGSIAGLSCTIGELAERLQEQYLLTSTALSDLAVFVEVTP
jgi:hypothetical protein